MRMIVVTFIAANSHAEDTIGIVAMLVQTGDGVDTSGG
jgi:hypothetical protein